MRDRWKPLVAVLCVALAAGILAAVAWAAPGISITSLQARASGTTLTSGPIGAGYDIRISATVTDTKWESTRWFIGGVPRCVNHEDQSAGNRTVDLLYQYEDNPSIKEGVLPDPGKVGPSEHVFPPPPGSTSQLRVELFNNDSCSGIPLATDQIPLTATVPGPNEELLAACQGMKVVVVLDESGSIASAGATQEVKDATKALAQGLVGTGARMAVFKFSTTADSDFIAPYQTVTQTWINGGLTTYLSRYNPGGSTNWQSGLAQARNETLTPASNVPDLVIFLTDGNPNRTGNGNTGYEEGFYTPMAGAVTVADQIKQTSHMFVIGVGAGVTDALSALRIQAVSGTKSFPDYPISTADYTLVTDFGDLEDALGDIASNLCSVTVTVKKETDEVTKDVWVSRPAWPFSGRTVIQPPAAQFSYGWFEPRKVDPVDTTSATQPGLTGTDGTLRYVWRPKAADSLSNITVSESPPARYTPASVTCTSDGATIFSTQDPAIVSMFTLVGLKVRDKVDCVVRNRVKRSTVQVVKQWVGTPSSATIFVDEDGAAPYDASTVATSSGVSTSFAYPVSTAATVGEVTVPAGYSATISCGGAPQASYAGGPFAVTAPATDGATLTCTITNTQLRSTVRVVKQWIGVPSSATIFVDANGVAPYDASTVATASGATTAFDYPVSTPVTVGEVAVPAGYSATIACGQGSQQPYTGGPFPVTSPQVPNATVICTITNKQKLSTVRVVKEWDGAPSSATIFVDQNGVAPFDASTVATADGHNTSFTYPVSTPVTVGEETVPAGYSATIACGLDTPQPYTGGPHPVNAPAVDGATLTCTITNTQLFSRVEIVKLWSGTPASATIFVDQNGVAPYDASTVATADGHNTSFTYPVSTPVTVGEVTVPAGYTATIACGQGSPQPYTGGPFPVVAPAAGGATLTCTVTNIIIPPVLATVRVVKRWVGAPASATIFVDQNGVAPYDASTVATADGDSAFFDYPVLTPVNVGEVTVPTGYTATIACGQDLPQPYTGGPFPVTAPADEGATLTCTITNKQQRSTVLVVKEWDGAPASTTIFVDQNGVAPYDAETVATADGHNASFTYPVSTPVTVGEVPIPTGYSATIACGQDLPQPYTGGPFPVTAPAEDGATLTCTITNTQQISTVRVVKHWVGTPSSATIFVDQDGVVPYDASTVATADGDSASFDYPVSTAATVGEVAVPAGYRATIHCGDTREAPLPYTGGPFAVSAPATDGDTLTCTITNIHLRSAVQVVKQWAGGASSTTIFVDANGSAPYDASTVATVSGDSTSFTYPVSTPVTVGESPLPNGFRATIDCGAGPQPYSGGPFAVTSPAAELAILTCTITNTPMTTVRVEKVWGGAPSATQLFVDASGLAPLDATTIATSDGESVSFDYPPSTQVTLGEIAVPPGYRSFIDCGNGWREIKRYSGGPFTVTSPATPNGVLNCTVANVKQLDPARLVIRKRASKHVFRKPGRVGFTITVRNRGRGIARSVLACDDLPRGLRFISARPAAQQVSGRLCWRIGRLNPRAKRTFFVAARVAGVKQPQTYVNVVDVVGANAINCPRLVGASTRQRPACIARARVVALPPRTGVLGARITFTG